MDAHAQKRDTYTHAQKRDRYIYIRIARAYNAIMSLALRRSAIIDVMSSSHENLMENKAKLIGVTYAKQMIEKASVFIHYGKFMYVHVATCRVRHL